MNKPKTFTFLPAYRVVLPCCGNETLCEVVGKYPATTERVSCNKCKAWFNARFFLNEQGVMVLEIRPITNN